MYALASVGRNSSEVKSEYTNILHDDGRKQLNHVVIYILNIQCSYKH
jgi:hypothetical protein